MKIELGGVGSTNQEADEGGSTWEPAYAQVQLPSPIQMDAETPHPAIGKPQVLFLCSRASQPKSSASLHNFVHEELCSTDLIR